MKRLVLIRHGKSSWELNVRDHDRVLLQRGIDDAHLIGKTLKAVNLDIDLIWSSTAARALQTATIITEYLDYTLTKFKLKRDLYTFNHEDLISTIKTCPDKVESLMIFSHNHGLTDTANQLGSQYFQNVPTTGVVVIEFDTKQWSEIKKGKTISHFFPKQLK